MNSSLLAYAHAPVERPPPGTLALSDYEKGAERPRWQSHLESGMEEIPFFPFMNERATALRPLRGPSEYLRKWLIFKKPS